jgi:DNA modification methylase
MDGDKADMVFTDPPFGNNLGYGRGQLGERRIESDDTTVFLEKMPIIIKEFSKPNTHALIWIQWRTFSVLEKCFKDFKLRTVVVWDKKQAGLSGGGFAEQHEFCCVFLNGHVTQNYYSGNVWQCARERGINRERIEHPHKKPIEILEKGLLIASQENDLILDMCLGSGSTMVASHQTNRKCYGMELSPKYCQVIIDRMKKLDPSLVIKKNGVEVTE